MNKRFAYAIVIVAPFALFVPEIFTGKSIFWGLPILQFYPWRELAFSQIIHGQLPLWNPYNGLGTPLLANYQSALVYPFTWVIFIFYLVANLKGLVWGHLFVNLLHLSIAGLGVLKIGEEKKYSKQASIISALSFSLGGYLLARFGFFSMIWAAAWLPWIFLYSEKAFKAGKFSINTIKLSVLISLLLLSGHAQLSWYVLLFSGIYLLFKINKPYQIWLKAFSQFIIASLLAVGLTAIQLLPTAELLLHSQRSNEVDSITSMTYSFWPWHFLNFINPHIFGHPGTSNYWGYAAYWEDAVYIGLLPILMGLAVIVLLLRKKYFGSWKKSDIAFFGTISLLSIVFSLGNNTPIYPWLYRYIPSFDMFNAPARYMIWFVFSLSLLAGTVFDHWKKPQNKTLYWVRLGTAGGFAIGIGALFMLLGGDSIKPTFIRATFEISVLVTLTGILYLLNPIQKPENDIEKSGHIWKWIAVCFLVCDLFYMNLNHTPVQNISTINTFMESGEFHDEIIYLPENTDYQFRYNTTLNFDDYQQTISAKQLANSNLANVNIFSRTTSLNNFEPMKLASYDNFITALNEKPSDQQKEILSAYGITQYGVQDKNNKAIINYENLNAADRIQVFAQGIHVNSIETMISEMPDMPCVYIIDTSSQIEQNKASECLPVKADISNLVWKDNKISFTINTPVDSWVLISDTYDAGWYLKIDGKDAKLSQANGFVKAFEVPGGVHTIVLNYLPRSVIIGSLISLASLILMCILVYRCR